MGPSPVDALFWFLPGVLTGALWTMVILSRSTRR